MHFVYWHKIDWGLKLLQWQKNRAQMDFVMLRNLQGVHAPLRLHMERRSAAQVNLNDGIYNLPWGFILRLYLYLLKYNLCSSESSLKILLYIL